MGLSQSRSQPIASATTVDEMRRSERPEERTEEMPRSKKERGGAGREDPPQTTAEGGARRRARVRGGVEEAQQPKRRGTEGGDPSMVPEQRLRKRGRTIAACTSPRPASFLTPDSRFNWFEEDIWTEVCKYLDGTSLVRLGMTNRWFHRLIMDDSIWRYACLRDLHVPPPRHLSSKWIHLYSSAFDGSHSYSFRQHEKHIDWMRIGAFFFDSPVALLTERLAMPRVLPRLGEGPERGIQTTGTCLLTNVRTGIWIADLQLVRCPVCNLNTCEGTMQVLDARHAELFLELGFRSGAWDYVELGTHRIEKESPVAAGGIFDLKHLTSPSTAGIFDLNSWVGQDQDWQPKARITVNAVAVNTNLQPNDGLHVKFHAMRAGGADEEVVSIRISQQLI